MIDFAYFAHTVVSEINRIEMKKATSYLNCKKNILLTEYTGRISNIIKHASDTRACGIFCRTCRII